VPLVAPWGERPAAAAGRSRPASRRVPVPAAVRQAVSAGRSVASGVRPAGPPPAARRREGGHPFECRRGLDVGRPGPTWAPDGCWGRRFPGAAAPAGGAARQEPDRAVVSDGGAGAYRAAARHAGRRPGAAGGVPRAAPAVALPSAQVVGGRDPGRCRRWRGGWGLPRRNTATASGDAPTVIANRGTPYLSFRRLTTFRTRSRR
jgi:hypothetical protein